MSLRECNVNWVSGITVYTPVSSSKQNPGISSVEVSCLGGMSTCNVKVEAVTIRVASAPGKLCKPEKILTQAKRSRKTERFYRKTVPPLLCVSISVNSDSLSIHTYISGRKKSKADYILIHQRCCLSLHYTTDRGEVVIIYILCIYVFLPPLFVFFQSHW